jgi:hypothetical protein
MGGVTVALAVTDGDGGLWPFVGGWSAESRRGEPYGLGRREDPGGGPDDGG